MFVLTRRTSKACLKFAIKGFDILEFRISKLEYRLNPPKQVVLEITVQN